MSNIDNENTSGQGGYPGQLGLSDAHSDYEVTCFICRQIMAEKRTMIPVKVLAVTAGGISAGGGAVQVQPLVNQVDGSLGGSVPHGAVNNIPYYRIQGGDGAIVVDPAVGDIGYMVVADRDISGVKATKGAANPNSHRRGSFSDGVYVGGILNAAPAQYLVFSSNGLTLADRNGNSIAMTSAGITITDANGNVLTFGSAAVALTGNKPLRASGQVTAFFGGGASVGLSTHTHPANGSPPTPGT